MPCPAHSLERDNSAQARSFREDARGEAKDGTNDGNAPYRHRQRHLGKADMDKDRGRREESTEEANQQRKSGAHIPLLFVVVVGQHGSIVAASGRARR